MEESQRAIPDEMEWLRGDQQLDAGERDQAVGRRGRRRGRAVDGIVQMQAEAIHATMITAYPWQCITRGVPDPRFLEVLSSMINAKDERQRGPVLPV